MAACPDTWRTIILEAIAAGLDVHSGLHTFLADDPEFTAAAAARGTSIVDYRRPPERMETAVGRRHGPGKRVILTVGIDCAIGKMSVALELRRAASAAGDRASFVATGQTGMMIEGWGVAVDRLISDFSQGTIEWLVAEGEGLGDWVIVEGQGSLDHPAYSSVTLALIHGATPHAMVMVHKPGLARARLRPPARGVLPDRVAARLHRPARADRRGRGARRRSWRSRSTRRSIRDDDEARGPDRSRRGRDRAADRRPVPVRRGPALAGDPRGRGRPAVGRRAMSLHRHPRGPASHLPRPVPDRPDRPRVGRRRDDGHRRAARRPVPGRRRGGGGLPGPVLRRDAGDDGRDLPVPAEPGGGLRGRSRRRRVGATAARVGRPGHGATSLRWNGGAKCALDIALHDFAGKVLGIPVHELLGLSGRDPADRLHDRHRRTGDRRPACRPGRRLPGTQDQVRRSAGPRDAPRRPRGVRRPDPGRCQHRLDPRRRRAAAARDRSPSASS